MPTGIVKWYDDSKGFGFITDENGEDLFVHFSSLKDPSVKSLNAGELVTFERTQLAQGPAASNVCRVAAAAPTKHHTPAPPQRIPDPQMSSFSLHKGLSPAKIIAVVVVFFAAYSIYTPSTYTPSTPPQPDVRAANTPVVQNMSYMLVEQDKIKSRLKDPDSAEFRNVFVSSKYAVCGEVNAKNSFGGYTGFVRFISGGDMQVVESDMAAGEMDKAWPQICKR